RGRRQAIFAPHRPSERRALVSSGYFVRRSTMYGLCSSSLLGSGLLSGCTALRIARLTTEWWQPNLFATVPTRQPSTSTKRRISARISAGSLITDLPTQSSEASERAQIHRCHRRSDPALGRGDAPSVPSHSSHLCPTATRPSAPGGPRLPPRPHR